MFRGLWERLFSDRSIAVWTVLAGMAAVVALGFAVVELRRDDPVPPAASPSAPVVGAPVLRMAAFAADRTAEIDAELEDVDGARSTLAYPSAVLDLTLRNDGDLPALVAEIRVTLRRADELPPCAATGGGATVSARYDIAVPVPPPPLPTRMDRAVRFEVPPRAIDRFTVSLGPATDSLGGYVYVVDVELLHDGGQRLPAGRAVVVVPPGFRPSERGVDPACASAAAATLDRAASAGGTVSPTVAAVREAYLSHVR